MIKRLKNPLYPFIGPIVEDPKKGIWYLPDEDTACKGLAYFDGQTNKLFNPPHAVLEKPSSLAVDGQGNVWIGTWFNGLYKLERKTRK